jgi:predicted RNA binding protein YcfA (HicA-like mRNA interferase family)
MLSRIKGDEFVKRVQRLGKARDVPVVFDKHHGKGSHGTLYYVSRKTSVKDRGKELGPGLLRAMLDQLGLKKSAL